MDYEALSDSELDEYIKELKDEKIKRAGLIKEIYLTGTEYQFKNKSGEIVVSHKYRDREEFDSGGCENYELFDKCEFHDTVELNCHFYASALVYKHCIISLMSKGYRIITNDGWSISLTRPK
jgi:hypothetical protein